MNVVFGDEIKHIMGDRYVTLELDTFEYMPGTVPVTAYAVLSPDEFSLQSVEIIQQLLPVHEALIRNYKKQNFDFCVQTIPHLVGKIDSFMDEFYAVILKRIRDQQANPVENWSHIVTGEDNG